MPQNTEAGNSGATPSTASDPRALAQWENIKRYWNSAQLQGEDLLGSYKELVTVELVQGLEPMKRKDVRDYLREKGVSMPTGRGHPILGVLMDLLPQSHEESAQSTGVGGNGVPHPSQNGNRVITDLIRIYTHQDTKYGGKLSDNIYVAERNFLLNCDTLRIPERTRVSLVHVMFKGLALEYFLRLLKSQPQIALGEVFQRMKDHFQTEDRKQRAMIKWNTITFRDTKGDGETDGQTLDKLVKLAFEMQNQLDSYYQDDRHLVTC